MLRYSIKPSKKIELKDFPTMDFYVAPDLSYVSGVTDYNVGLVDGEDVIIKSPYLIGSEANKINVVNVNRQGKIAVQIILPVKHITKALNFPIYNTGEGNYILAFNQKVNVPNNTEGDYIVSSITQNYVEYNGDICYYFNNGSMHGYLVDHRFYSASIDDLNIAIETYFYIEDGKLVIGDNVYEVDFSKVTNDNSVKPEIKLDKYSEPITGGDTLGVINGNACIAMTDGNSVFMMDYTPKYWKRVSKFIIQKAENPLLEPEDVLYGGYKHYVTYQDTNYYVDYVYDEEELLGYGVSINGKFYPVECNYDEFNVSDNYKDIPYEGSSIYIEETDEYVPVYDSLISASNGGKFILFIDTDSNYDIQVGNFITAVSNNPLIVNKYIEYDELNNPFITYDGVKYFIKNHLADTVNMSGVDYMLTYTNDTNTKATANVNGETLHFNINGNGGTLDYKIYYEISAGSYKVTYGKKNQSYSVTNVSGVTINDIVYPVIDGEYVSVYENVSITLEVVSVNGSSTYICYPVVSYDTISGAEEDEKQRELSSMLVEKWESFTFRLRKDTFGDKEFTVDNGLMNSMTATKPYNLSDSYLLQNKINIFRIQDYVSFKLPLLNKTANNIRREDTINNDFTNYIKEQSVNTIVDMEKDVYYPYLKKTDGSLEPIEEIRFNLHFRNRNLENWKVIEDDMEFSGGTTFNSQKCNWFITDLDYYSIVPSNGKTNLQNSSDLLGLLGFSLDDVKNKAKRLSKSFLRLSFYSTDDPKTQVLLSTSTVFFDCDLAYKKYLDSKNKEYKYENVATNTQTDDMSTFTEISDSYNFVDETRLSSRFVVKDKYHTDSSAEGYYLYMFKEYSKKMRTNTIYLKVEFNHAGIGKTIPFMLPRYDNGSIINITDSKLKNGFNIKDIYKQTFIPINIVYDDSLNKYIYYLPDELNTGTEIMQFNLFEVKFANESIVRNES